MYSSLPLIIWVYITVFTSLVTFYIWFYYSSFSLIFLFLFCLEWVKAGITTSITTVRSSWDLVVVTIATLCAACLHCSFATLPHHIHEILGSWGLIRDWRYWDVIFDFPPILRNVKFRWSHLVSSFSKYSMVCRWARKMCRGRFCLSGLPCFFVYMLYLASLIGVPCFWPYRAQKNACPASLSCAWVASTSPNT